MGRSPYGARLLSRAVVRPFLPLLLGILACGRAAPIATVPFDGPGHLVFVHVTAGQRDAGWWMLDSGFEYSVVSTQTADALGLARGAASGVPQPGGTVEEAWTRAVALAFGGVPFRAESLAVIDLSGLEPIVGRRIGGILGHDVFVRYVMGIDYGASTIDVHEPATFTYRGAGVELPLWIEHGEPFFVAQLFADGRMAPAKLKLDTGSMDFIGLNGSFVDQTNLVAASRARIPALGAALGGNPEHFLTRLDSMVVGPWAVKRPVMGYSASLERDGDAGTVGADFLRRFHPIFDYARRRLILESQPTLADATPVDASGLMLVATGERFDTLQVLSVAKDSPAMEAGLGPGDRITAWADIGEPLTLDAARRRLAQPGQRLDLVVERAGARRTISLRTRERI